MDKVALGQVFSEYFSFPCQLTCHQMPHIHIASWAGTIGQLVTDVPNGISLTAPHGERELRVVRNLQTFWRYTSPLSSQSKCKLSKKPAIIRRQTGICYENGGNVFPKRLWTHTWLHDVTTLRSQCYENLKHSATWLQSGFHVNKRCVR
jgi:hypothetical protein